MHRRTPSAERSYVAFSLFAGRMRRRLLQVITTALLCCACGGHATSFVDHSNTGGESSSGGGLGAGGAPVTGGTGGVDSTGGTGGVFQCDLPVFYPDVPAIACGGMCGYRQCWTPEGALESFGLSTEDSNGECPPAELLRDDPSQWCARTALCQVEPIEDRPCCYSVRSCIK